MKKTLLQMGLFLSIATTSTFAQQIDRVDIDEINNGALHNGLDEIVHLDGTIKTETSVQGLVKNLPVTKDKQYSYSRYKTEKGRSLLIGKDGNKEVFSVELKRNKMDGNWMSRYSNGQLLDSGELNKNITNGEWKTWYSNGQLRTIRTYSANKWFTAQNQILRYNPKTTTNTIAQMAVKRDGTYENITNASNSFKDMAAEADAYSAPFAHCIHHGLYMNYYSNGVVKDSGYYKDGFRDGLWIENYNNGQLFHSGSYLKGKKNGGWKSYNKNGKLIELSEYQNGKLVHRKKY